MIQDKTSQKIKLNEYKSHRKTVARSACGAGLRDY